MMPSQTATAEGTAGARREVWVKFSFDRESRMMTRMSGDQRSLWWSLRVQYAGEGFTADPEELWNEAKYFCGFSRYKFFKLMPTIVKFFTQIGDMLYYEQDEASIDEALENISKFQTSGRLGGLRKAENERKRQLQLVPDQPTPLASPLVALPTNREDIYNQERTTPPTSTGGCNTGDENLGGGAGALPQTKRIQTQTPVNQPLDGYSEFREHCKAHGFSQPSPKLWAEIRAKFPVQTTAEILKILVKFDGQTGPGLWNHHPADVLLAESIAQANPNRKPPGQRQRETATERIQRVMATK